MTRQRFAARPELEGKEATDAADADLDLVWSGDGAIRAGMAYGLCGQALARDYCSACHRVSAEQAPPPKVTVGTGVGSEEYEAPSFRQIAARPGRNDGYLRTFIQAPHYPMREQLFIPDELEQIVTYILSLKTAGGAEW